jgi:hypothetical protein
MIFLLYLGWVAEMRSAARAFGYRQNRAFDNPADEKTNNCSILPDCVVMIGNHTLVL